MSMKRFRVAENSMLPTLKPGDEVVTTESRGTHVGDLVVFKHPNRPGFWMVKRRVEPPHQIEQGRAWVMSDNPAVTEADSRTLGPLDESELLPVVERYDDATFAEAVELVAEEDQSIAAVVESFGLPPFWSRPPGFATLVLLILEQQVSLESGAAVYNRLRDEVGIVSPDTIHGLDETSMRELGITRQKAQYLAGLARAVLHGSIDLEALGSMSPEKARSELTRMKGIGTWTADAYLLSALGHLDVFPIGDRALQVGSAEVLGMASPPDPEQLEIISEPWRPVRAAAARLIWHSYLSRRGRGEPGDDLLRADEANPRRVELP